MAKYAKWALYYEYLSEFVSKINQIIKRMNVSTSTPPSFVIASYSIREIKGYLHFINKNKKVFRKIKPYEPLKSPVN
jgi:hypothetical protein